MTKRAVVLFNLGGPLKRGDVRPFLFSFFMDESVIALPLPLRWLLARAVSFTRGAEAYAPLGYKSPLLENTQAQAYALEAALGADWKVFTCMRHWHPRSDEVALQVKAYGPDDIVLLPLYPQYSVTTTGSALRDWDRAALRCGLDAPARKIFCYPEDAGFIAASADLVRQKLEGAPAGTRVLFSAHGLPKKIIAGGDPYQAHCEQTAAAVARAAGLSDWVLCYQSRVGPLKWIGPSTGDALRAAARDKKGVVVYPLAFVSEHVETLVDIEIKYRALAAALSIPFFARAETVGTHPAFIAGLAGLARVNAPSPVLTGEGRGEGRSMQEGSGGAHPLPNPLP